MSTRPVIYLKYPSGNVVRVGASASRRWLEGRGGQFCGDSDSVDGKAWLHTLGIAAAVVIASSAVVAGLGILVTAGGRDQQFFHLPSVMYLREKAPNIDIVNMPTATDPRSIICS